MDVHLERLTLGRMQHPVRGFLHGTAAVLSIVGAVVLWYRGAGELSRQVALLIFGLSLVALYTVSSLYHSYPWPITWKKRMQRLDHSMIYVLIAGTYTPFLLVAMRTNTGWWMFGTIWALATAGILKKLWFRHRYPKIALASYLVMGWLAVIAAPQLAAVIGANGMAWLVAGGLLYSIGAIFYVARKLPFNHAIWHVFVLAGGLCHFLGIVWHVLPADLPA